jgi:hypothetical protein
VDFRIADTFTDSLAKLTGDEQRVVKTTAFDLQVNPAHPSLSLERLDRGKDKNFWSVRASRDIRLIVHRTPASLLLCYVGHHDAAYDWAERRKLEAHPTTGAAQLVEVRERVQDIIVPRYVQEELPAAPKRRIFANLSEDKLLGYGVPLEWLDEVRQATEDTVLDLAEHLPSEAAEALLQLATGNTPRIPQTIAAGADPFEHPDALQRFRLVANVDELALALEYPWEKWAVFLHPAQREAVEREYSGPARVSGSAGTGKTIVALHRAVYLARSNPNARVLLTTFSETLANMLRAKLRVLVASGPRIAERLEVHALNTVAVRLYERNVGRPKIASQQQIQDLVMQAAVEVGVQTFSSRFLVTEWREIVDAWQLETWESYRDVARLGRKTRLPEKQRVDLWAVYERVQVLLHDRSVVTYAQLFSTLSSQIRATNRRPYDFVVVDEAQDVSVAQLRFLAALGADRPNSLFFAGDLGQRIFQQPFSWKALGVDIRGRSRTLRINYRTSHQIRAQADRLLGPQVADVDGNGEDRGAISVFNGPDPEIRVLDTIETEARTVSGWLTDRVAEGVKPHEIGVFVRSKAELERARAAVQAADLPFKVLDDSVETTSGNASISTMHLAKGLEFRVVVVMACDDEIIPLQERIETVGDDADLEEVYNTERHLLYVACTRARDHLLVTSVAPASEFLDDLRM